MKSMIERLRHNFQEVREMHKLLDTEIEEIWQHFATNNKQLNYVMIRKYFGDFKYEELPKGRIKVIDSWYTENIVLINVMGHSLWVHKLIAGQLSGAIVECHALGYGKYINFDDGGGCYCARHKLHKRSRGLSTHAWAISVDMNPISYPFGGNKVPPKRVVEVFNKWGFIWGGIWRSKDNMHFEVSKFVV